MYKNSIMIAKILLLLAAPLIIIGLWATWYRATFDPMKSDNRNYAALTSLYGKADICKDKDILGRYALTCTSIYSFCNDEAPIIERVDSDYAIDKTDACRVFMSATKPFRILFLPSAIIGLFAFGAGMISALSYLQNQNNNKTR